MSASLLERSRWLVPCFVTLLWVSPASAQSEDDLAQARSLGQEGLALFDKGEYEAALAKLDAAETKASVPPLGLFAARALARLGKLLAAEERYQRVLAIPLAPNSPEVWRQAKIDAKDELAKLTASVPTLELSIEGAPAAEVQVGLDGAEPSPWRGAPLRLDPGDHRVVARHGKDERSATVSLVVGQPAKLQLRFPQPVVQAEPAGPSPLLVSGAVVLGLGGAGLVAWGATSAVAMAKADAYGCEGALCARDDVSDLTALRTGSTASFYAGAGLALTGGVLLLVSALTGHDDAPAPASALRVEPLVGPTGVGLRGSF